MRGLNLFSLLLLAVLTTGCVAVKEYPAAPAYRGHPKGEFPITASYAFYQPFINDRQMELVKEAGFNNLRQQLSYQDLDSLLVLARKHDINVLASIYEIRDTLKTRKVVERYKDNPMVWGFNVMDEPSASKFSQLAAIQERMLEYAPDQNGFVNLLPAIKPEQLEAHDYRSYVEEYVRTVNPPYISLDIYPIKVSSSDGHIYVDNCLYRTMSVISDVSKQSKRPFWSYVLCNKHRCYPKPTEEYLRFQIFTSLGYGAQGLIYFTYTLPDFDREKGEFTDAPIDRNGNPTDVWYMVRNLNREVKNLTDVFLGAEVVNVAHTGARLPQGTERLSTLPAPFSIIDSDGEGLMVSHLRNGDKEYLLIVNRDIHSPQQVYLSRERAVARLYGDGTERLEVAPRFTISPGGYALFRM